MLQQADEEQLDALDGRRKIKGLCETRWSSRADALNILKSAHALIIDTLDDLGTGGDRNAKQLKLALQISALWLLLLLLNVCFNTVWHYPTFYKDLQLTW